MARQKSGATTLAHVQSSMGNDFDIESHLQAQKEEHHSQVALGQSAKLSENTESEWVVFKLVNTKKQGRVYIDCINDAVNPETGKVERMRLLSGVDSIWLKDQKNVTEDYAKNNRRSLVFEGKILRLPKWDTSAIEFARLSSHCIDNPKRKSGSKTEFFEWNPAKQAEEAKRKQLLKIEAMKKAFSVDDEQMKKHAMYLGITPIDEVGFAKTTDVIRNEYAIKADLDPVRFMESFSSPLVEISFLIKKALSQSKIDVGRERGKVYWATGKFICSVPANQTVLDCLLELSSTTNAEGREFLQELKIATNG